MSRVSWNFGGGPVSIRLIHLIIVYHGSDRLSGLAVEGGAKCGRCR
jgi:hypothetical protein